MNIEDNIDEFASGRDLKYDKSNIKFEYTVPDDLDDPKTDIDNDEEKIGEDKVDTGATRKVAD